MERKGLRKRDILRIDGLLPPTRRLPVCDAVSGTPDKKKDKKWSIGGILRRISSIRDYDSSSNDEEIVYCKRMPRKPARFANGRANGVGDVVLHAMDNDSERGCKQRIATNQVRQLTDSPHLLRDSVHSRSSDGSLDGLGRKSRRNKLKARAEAKRDHLCADSSSDDDCRQSNSSLNRLHGVDAAQNNQRSNTTCSRRTRAARTERYIKRLSRDDGNGGSGDTLNDCPERLYNRTCSLDYYEDANGSYRPPAHPRRTGLHPSNRALSAETPCIANASQEMVGHLRRYSIGQYVTDVNENDASASHGDPDDRRAGNFFTYPAKHACHHAEPFDRVTDRRRLTGLNNRPPEPPPRDPRYRVYGYGYGSYSANKHQTNTVPSYFQWSGNGGDAEAATRADYFRSYGSNNEIARYNDTAETTESMSPYVGMELRNSLERVNNRCNSNRSNNNPIEWAYGQTEAARCRLRNTRNDQLNDANHRAYKIIDDQSANRYEATASQVRETVSSRASACEQRGSVSPLAPSDKTNKRNESDDNGTAMLQTEEEERRRSSRNLEEALSELEAIYNSLRLGDEDLLDRAERRSMEEFSLRRRSGSELDAVTAPVSPDRTKDDMAYRRMHPKERPTSLSDIAGQSTLAQISYLITSPMLAHRDPADDPSYSTCRRDEPDVTRDDVVFRSINHANNTLRVADPQPPFGIPLGPVTAATESDYLHTTPTKPEQSRSPYIPQCEPDVVTDDLAYRALRKDALAARNGAGAQDYGINEVALVAGKKRAVRSLSANLYGLINHDRIHLRREPNLDEVEHSLRRRELTPERPAGYLRRVVSDGELSDNDARRRKQPVLTSDIDINGNHPTEEAYRSKLGATLHMARESPKKEKESSIAPLSDAVRSSEALDDEFWHEYLRSDSGVLPSNGEHAAETDFTAYTRLCQDLVDLIKSDDDATPRDESEMGSSAVPVPDQEDHLKMKTGLKPLASIGSHRSKSQRANAEKIEDAGNAQKAQSAALTSTRNLDFYLRMADDNVKLIAEAFGSVADHLRDSRLFARENSSASRASECQSGSTRSSTLYQDSSQEDRANGNDDDQLVVDASPGRDEGDQDDESNLSENASSTAELDLSRAVRDLQLAAASLHDHGQEIEDLGTGCDWIDGARNQDAAPIRTASPRGSDAGEEDGPIRKLGLIADALRHAQQRGREAGAEREIGTRFDEKCRAGELTVCRELEDRVPDVTNSIVTKCSMLLLACLLALLLAIVAAS